MHEFNLKYQTDSNFRNFINEVIDINSPLWEEYKILKTYEALVDNESDIKSNPNSWKFMEEPIDTMIKYFQSHEEYEKCSKLKEIKTYL
jgi:hypothetical protein